MAIFITAVLRGLGLSFGVAVGLLAFVIANEGLNWLFGKHDRLKRALEERSDQWMDAIAALVQVAMALEEREKLAKETAIDMGRLASAMEKYTTWVVDRE